MLLVLSPRSDCCGIFGWVTCFCDGDSSVVVEDADSMSECAMVNLMFQMVSVKGARNDTLFAMGNIGRDCANDIRLPPIDFAPLVRMEVMLYDGSGSTVDSDVVESPEDDVAELVKLGTSSSVGVGISFVQGGLLVARGVNIGRCTFDPDSLRAWAGLKALLKVFRAVGETADKVSSRRLFEPFPPRRMGV